MSNEAVCRTAPATPGLLIIDKGVDMIFHKYFETKFGALYSLNIAL